MSLTAAFALNACGASSDGGVSTQAVLGIYAFGTTTIDRSDQGHSFLSLENTGDTTIDFANYPIEPGQEITLGYFPSSVVWINYDALIDADRNATRDDVSYMKKHLSADGIQRLIDYSKEFSGTEYDGKWNNCTTYAIEAWNQASSYRTLTPKSVLGADARLTAASIGKSPVAARS